MKITSDMFNAILKKRHTNMTQVLSHKAKEYANEDDRLFNFRLASQIIDRPMPEVLWGMALKHLVSVLDLIYGRLSVTPENVNEKVGDLINYLVLLEAVFAETYPPPSKNKKE